ncbi:MAG: MoaD/ThiS family protein [Rhodospirillaceae bacterium]|jgi:sulfur-carrier protein|nr:MoaD/ThiS family protein [Rhodospirillaceae bacterium]MBT5373642.1 MoaD/ThiS family protein [Rhodospirillaceae bacterium]MBT5658906.1 MoaD/ThiS family protein [Rhodospirillaceae bacterium]MBT5751507.1 MoaD/ThiS family protein [Rhodospirillaceae bacterium]
MKITLKLYAMLDRYLPKDSERHQTSLNMPEDATVQDLIGQFNLPSELTHLVLLNGIYLDPKERLKMQLNEDDVIAIWPPIAGG